MRKILYVTCFLACISTGTLSMIQVVNIALVEYPETITNCEKKIFIFIYSHNIFLLYYATYTIYVCTWKHLHKFIAQSFLIEMKGYIYLRKFPFFTREYLLWKLPLRLMAACKDTGCQHTKPRVMDKLNNMTLGLNTILYKNGKVNYGLLLYFAWLHTCIYMY